MQAKKGIQVSHGVAIGRAMVLDAEDWPIPRRTIPAADVQRQGHRLEKALQQSCADIERLREQTADEVGEEFARIFDTHLTMLRDPHLVEQFQKMIDQDRVTAESAVYAVMRRQAWNFERMHNTYIRERARDIWDLERHVLGHLIGESRAALANLQHEAILIAHDLTPAQTMSLDISKIKAIATDLGGQTSHTAILAHARGIPAIVGLEDLTAIVSAGDTVIVDGNRGVVVTEPDAAQLMQYRMEAEKITAVEDTLGASAQLPAVTRDSIEISVMANIEFPGEIDLALAKGATGIGLYRTEFLYLSSESEPTEEDHLQAYLEAIRRVEGRPLTIRSLDLGADKFQPDSFTDHHEPNPFLGCRSIRLCLQNLPLFKTQLRALMRASAEGPINIMFPLISNVMELRQAKMILYDVMEDLEDQGVPYCRDIPIGTMIEVPSAALQANILAKEVDFFSIGTNDLIQYTVAADRSNERIANLYSAAHPAVLGLIKDVIRAAGRSKIDVSLCGEMAGEPEFAMILIGLGLRSLSVAPPAIPQVKKLIRSVSIDHCKRVARKVTSFDSDREVLNYIRVEVAKIIPDVLDGRTIGLG